MAQWQKKTVLMENEYEKASNMQKKNQTAIAVNKSHFSQVQEGLRT